MSVYILCAQPLLRSETHTTNLCKGILKDLAQGAEKHDCEMLQGYGGSVSKSLSAPFVESQKRRKEETWPSRASASRVQQKRT